MNKITELNRKNIQSIHDDIREELASLGEKLGVSIVTKGCRYSSKNASVKVEIQLLSEEGRPISKEENFLNNHHEALDVPKEWLGAMLKCPSGKFYYLRGYKQRSYKRPFLIEDAVTGKEYTAPKTIIHSFTLAKQ